MSNKNKILEILKVNELTVKEIAERTQFNENEVRVYIHRLLEDNLIKEIGKKNRWIIYTAINKNHNFDSDSNLLSKLVLLMIKAGINSENYGITINESEINPIINKLMERDKNG